MNGIDERQVTNFLQALRNFRWRDISDGGNVGAPSQSMQAQVLAQSTNVRNARPRPMRFHEINTVFRQATLPEVMSSQIIQEDVGENDKVE
jgi:hypothetical protein